MRIPAGVWHLVKEAARHLLRRPVVGVVAAARCSDGRWLLVQRSDTGQWAMPGGTVEWGETLQQAIVRELREEAGVEQVRLEDLAGVYSDPGRDMRFHAVTVVVHATVEPPTRGPANSVEIGAVRLFAEDELPSTLSHGMTVMLSDARARRLTWE
ncbi:MAG: NUDIX domain-containing protein [Polyangiaceae bacterium]|nr:NUDIX domain-containing protein [Polyangiaceae bacterium]